MGSRSDRIVIQQQHRIKNVLNIVGVCVLVGIGYPAIAGEFTDALAFVNGAMIGLFGGIGMALHQDFSLHSRAFRQHFLRRLVLVALLYTAGFAVLIIIVTGITRSLESNETFINYIQGQVFQEFLFKGDYVVILLYAVVLSSTLSFWFGMQRKVDGKVLWNMVSGKYVQPKEEERIFMFLDMKDSTKIAEQLGEMRYFEFVNDFFADITPAILKTRGHIYRYVGDEIVVTWPVARNTKYERSIKTHFLARNELRRQKEKYLARYNIIPSFKTAFHSGRVVVGEIGDVKSQFVFHGDVMYITGLIEKQCNKLNKSLLVSSTLMDKVAMPKLYKVEHCGPLEHDRNMNIELYSITEKTEFHLN